MNLFELFVKIGVDDQASNGIKNIGKTIQDAKKPVEEYRRDVMKLAQTYKSQGMDMSSAMKKAYSEIDKSQYETAKNSKNDSKKFSDNWVDAGEKVSGIAEKIGNGLKTAAKIGTAAVGAATAGITALTTAAVNNYAEYEQLVGGVDTLFKDASQKVQQYAANAYKTAGMSANDYMANATAFSASLISSLGGDTEKAAEYANRAMVSMSDNANRMGTSLDSIVQTYQSMSRGNFAMLDNLKLGYGGTKAELERLIKDAASYTDIQKEMGVTVDASSMSFDNIVNAIAVVQGKLGIVGATAQEAGTTIEGSVNSMKAAWQNLVTGIADDNADLDTLIGNFVQSAETAAGNIIPRLTQILSGMGSVIEQLAPVLAAEIPGLITSVLPSLVSAGTQLVVGLTSGLIGALPDLIAAVPSIIESFVTAISDNWPIISESGMTLLSMFTSGVSSAVPDFIENLPQIVDGFLGFITEKMPDILDKGVELLDRFAFGIIEYIPDLVAQLPAIINSITEFFVENFPKIVKKGGELLGKLLAGIIGTIPEIAVQLPAVITAIVDALEAGWEQLKNVGKYLLEGLWEGISDKVAWLKNKVSGVVDTIKGWFTGSDGFDTHSPSRWSRKVFRYIMDGGALGLDDGLGNVMSTVKSVGNTIKSGMHFGIDSVDFASSGLGMSSAGIINSIGTQSDGDMANGLTVNLVLPDGSKFASWQLPYLIKAGSAAGTPIAEAQRA